MINNKKYIKAQSNNSWIFPAVGFALVTTKARHCPGKLFEVTAEAVAELVKPENHKSASLCGMFLSPRQHSMTSAELLPTRRGRFLERSFFKKYIHFIEKLRKARKAVEGQAIVCLSSEPANDF